MPPLTPSAAAAASLAADPEFSTAELAEARRLNALLLFMPRFRRPGPVARGMIQSFSRVRQSVTPGMAGVRITTRGINWQGQSVSLRILAPVAKPRGVYIDWHGGGWTIGTAAIDDPVNSRIVKDCGLVVVSVDYGLLPATAFPTMLAQSAAAADWVFSNSEKEFGARDIFMGGESAGAHLCACTVLKLKASRPDFARLKGVVLFYGVYDLGSTPSVRAAPRDALVLHGPSMREGLGTLVDGHAGLHRRHPDVSPLYADLSGLPPALFLVGTLDPLIDDSRLMAERWRAAGGEARLVVFPEAPHAFNRFPTAMGARTNAFVRAWIGDRLAREGAGPAKAGEIVAAE